jgi:hypothetical protein
MLTLSGLLLSVGCCFLLLLGPALCVELETAEFLAGLNCGGIPYAISDGRSFQSDANFFTGTAPDEVYSNAAFSPVPLSAADINVLPLYNSHRVVKSPFDIKIALEVPQDATETVVVRLYFAEVLSSGRTAGYRVFDVLLNGEVVLDNLDVFSAAPIKNGIFFDFAVTGASSIEVSFSREVRQPMLSGIALYNTPVGRQFSVLLYGQG